MSDLSLDFDARRVGWWQRRSVIRQIKRTTWLTGADQDLRVQRARAAHTRGELNALTRDLSVGGPGPAAQPSWTPPTGALAYGVAPQRLSAPQSAAVPKRNLKTSVLIGGLVLLVTCGGGLVSCVSAIVSSVSDISSLSSEDNLLSEDGWSTMVADLNEDIDSSNIVGAVVRRESAVFTVRDGADSVYTYLYGGDVTDSVNGFGGAAHMAFDLTLVAGSLVERTVERAQDRSGLGLAADATVFVSGRTGSEPTLVVTFPDEPGSYSLEVNLSGTTVAENRVS